MAALTIYNQYFETFLHSLAISSLLLFLIALISFLLFRTNRKTKKDLDEKNRALIASRRLNKIILGSLNFQEVIQKIADIIPQELYFGTGVVSIIDTNNNVIKRVAASNTPEAREAIQALKIPFNLIEIPLDDQSNLMVKAIKENKMFITEDVHDVFVPVINKDDSKIIQQIMKTKSTVVCPIIGSKGKAIGVFLASTKKSKSYLTEYELDMISNFVDGVGVAIEHALFFSQVEANTEYLQEANNRLKELDKLKDEFVSLASHELRTPMTAIKSYLWMVMTGHGGELTEKQRFYLGRAYGSVERLIKLVNDMLNISRIESGRLTLEMQQVDLIKLVQEVIEEVTPRAQELEVSIVQQNVDDIPQVIADPDKVKEIIFNLIGNSLKFTPRGGTITISFNKNGDMLETKISDTGIGIVQEDLPKLFQKFGLLPGSYITNQPVSGTGLGLYICRAMIALHKGKIWVNSEGKGKGAQFTFSLKIYNVDELQKMAPVHSNNNQEKLPLIHTQI